jgi:inactivated superfamily I helicase
MDLHGIRGARTEWHVQWCLLLLNTASEHHQQYAFSSEIVSEPKAALVHDDACSSWRTAPRANVRKSSGIPGRDHRAAVEALQWRYYTCEKKNPHTIIIIIISPFPFPCKTSARDISCVTQRVFKRLDNTRFRASRPQ